MANDICQMKKRVTYKAQRFIHILCYVTAAGLGGGAITTAWTCAVCRLEEYLRNKMVVCLVNDASICSSRCALYIHTVYDCVYLTVDDAMCGRHVNAF